MESRGESDHFLEILENLEETGDSRDSSSEKTPFVMTTFAGPEGYNPPPAAAQLFCAVK